MAGLNPDGLGRNRAYDDLESESHSTGKVLFGDSTTPIIFSRQPILSGEFSTTSTSYSTNSDVDGHFPSVNSLNVSGMTPVVRMIGALAIGDSSATASARLFTIYDGPSNTPIEETEVTVNSTVFSEVDSGWLDLTSVLPQQDVFFAPRLQIKTSDGSFSARAARFSAMVGFQP